jgi:hypothetical protein
MACGLYSLSFSSVFIFTMLLQIKLRLSKIGGRIVIALLYVGDSWLIFSAWR